MTSSARRQPGLARTLGNLDESEIDGASGPPPAPPPPDPARVAVRLLLGHAMAAAGISTEEVGRDGAVCLVVVPATGWAPVARDEWRAGVRADERFDDGLREDYWHKGSWAAWMPSGQPSAHAQQDAAESFATAVSKGRHCAGFVVEVAWLPADLVLAADYRLTLPTLTAADIGGIARELCGHDASEWLVDGQAAVLTPRLLRLARRLEQTADDYVLKLRDLLDRAAAPPAPERGGSPRAAPTLDRLHGMDEAVAWGHAVARDLAAWRGGSIGWADVDRGCLLSGPPGCGKTLFARALAATCGTPLVVGSYGAWHGTGSAHQGELLKAMKKTFDDARARAPSILFIDEVDSFPDRGAITHNYAEWEIQVVNALLAQIDGVEGREGVILVAACNHPENLDPALIRSGRLDRHIRIRLPDRPALARIFREHLGADIGGADLSGAALAATGASGADCERLVRGARRRAREAFRDMSLADLLDEVGGADTRSAEDLWTAAVHEAGHAVMISQLRPGALGMVSLLASGGQGGATAATFSVSGLVRAADVQEMLMFLLAGRAAEQTILGEPSSGAGGGAGSDLARATEVAAAADTSLGLGVDGDLTWTGAPDAKRLAERLAANPALAARTRRRIDDAYAASIEILRPRTTAVTAVANALFDRRVLDGPEVEGIVRQHAGAGGQP